VDTRPLVQFARESGRRNKVAASWSAAAFFAFVAWAIGAYVSWTSVAHRFGALTLTPAARSSARYPSAGSQPSMSGDSASR
jgi:hypothetical protein